MLSKLLPLAALGLTLGLSGCYLADGAATLAKMASERNSSDAGSASQPSAPASAPSRAAEEPPPPPPEAAVPPAAVQVESLPAPQ